MITVRQALVTDWESMRDLLYAFWADPLTPPWFANAKEHPSGERLLVGVLGQGYSFIAHDTINGCDKPVGMLLAMKNNVLFVTNEIIEEMAWFVYEEYRGSKAGLLLLSAWEAMIDAEKAKGVIIGGMLHTMVDSPIDLKRRGYRAADTTYLR